MLTYFLWLNGSYCNCRVVPFSAGRGVCEHVCLARRLQNGSATSVMSFLWYRSGSCKSCVSVSRRRYLAFAFPLSCGGVGIRTPKVSRLSTTSLRTDFRSQSNHCTI